MLTLNGLAARNGDRFVAPTTDSVISKPPSGADVTVTRDTRTEFIPQPGGETQSGSSITTQWSVQDGFSSGPIAYRNEGARVSILTQSPAGSLRILRTRKESAILTMDADPARHMPVPVSMP